MSFALNMSELHCEAAHSGPIHLLIHLLIDRLID